MGLDRAVGSVYWRRIIAFDFLVVRVSERKEKERKGRESKAKQGNL